MPVSAGISALGGVVSGALGYFGSKNASNAQVQQQQNAIAAQEDMFNRAQGALQPYINSGQSVLPTLQALLTPGASQTATLQSLPGFKFQSEWGNLAATNALAARGLGGSSGPLAKAISDYNQGLAGTSFGNLTGMLQTYANMGSGAAGALAGNATQTGANLASTYGNIGNAQASGILGGTNALSGAVGGVANSASNALLLSSLLQARGSNMNPSTGGIYGGIQVPGFNPIAGAAGGGAQA